MYFLKRDAVRTHAFSLQGSLKLRPISEFRERAVHKDEGRHRPGFPWNSSWSRINKPLGLKPPKGGMLWGPVAPGSRWGERGPRLGAERRPAPRPIIGR